MQTALKTSFNGAQLKTSTNVARKQQRAFSTVAMAGVKKVNTIDDGWTKGIGSVGYFMEDKERSSVSPFKRIEDKKLLSSVEKLGLLSKAEKAGITLTKIEELGLLSTAEDLGLLSLAEDVLVMEPAKITSIALPFVVLAILSLSVIPHDNLFENILSYSVAGVSLGVAGAAFIGGLVVAGLQED